MTRILKIEKSENNYLFYDSNTGDLLFNSQGKTIKGIDIYEKLFSNCKNNELPTFDICTDLADKNDKIFIDNFKLLLKSIIEEIKKTKEKQNWKE